ncbi:unnamed protein product [Adineta ricciae]|uniref:Uncharacterized protein n=1 Tax=Adineta ricciae TaxID=249248 RepID=A0A814UQY3_ADIRI|nr:unnamed protein product [Adineta ricciae]CAF1177686.1 unnamed protein product [Adineta ricciae]
MANINRFPKLIYFLFLVGLYLVRINANEEYNTVTTDSTSWSSDTMPIFDKFHLSFVRNMFETLGSRSDDSDDDSDGPTAAQKYGYGFLSVLVISTFSLIGAAIFPLMKKPYYKYINAFFTSVAVGALFANSAFELFPAIIQYESGNRRSVNHTEINTTKPDSENDEEEPIVPLFLWQMLILVLTAYFFYFLEMMINVFIVYRDRRKKEVFEFDHDNLPPDDRSTLPALTPRSRSETILSATFPNIALTFEDKQTPAIGWVIIIGDGIHNIADGLAIGAAFSDSIILGIAQAIAVACQEFPSELGEMMILIESGFTIKRALLFNFFSACTAFLGFFVGVGLSENETARIWIFSVTAGIFTYIALVDLWPTLMPEAKQFEWRRFACVTAGYLFGVFVMFGLGILTEQLVPHPTKR